MGFHRTLILRACDQLRKKVNVPGKFWPSLARGAEKETLFLCTVEEFSTKHKFERRDGGMEGVRVTVDGSTDAEDSKGYWMNMLTYSQFKECYGPVDVPGDVEPSHSSEQESNNKDQQGLSNSMINLTSSSNASSAPTWPPFWSEFAYTKKTGLYQRGVAALKKKVFRSGNALCAKPRKRLRKVV